MKPIIDPEFAALIPPLAKEELEQLESNLLAEGCRDPLIIWRGILIDGHNRFAICERHGLAYATHQVDLPDRDAALVWIARNQLGRRNLAPYARAELAFVIEQHLPRRTGNQYTAESASVRNQTEAEPPTVAAPKAVGISRDTYQKAKVVAAKAPEPVKAKLRAGETTINKEYKAITQRERHEQQVAAVESWTGPSGKYRVIVADPPWAYESRVADPTHRAANPYPSMSAQDIAAMPVADHALDDCLLWLWTTNAFMVQAHDIAKAWGFEVRTILTWAKDRMGTGDWLRGQTEHCLLAVKGKPVVTLTNQTTLLHGPLREHSRKPDEFYALVERLCPGTKLELFSRTKRPGWTCAGAEVGRFGE